MPRIRLGLAYNGIFFSGQAAQSGLRTIEGVLTSALATVLCELARFTVAERTDVSVHAAAQVVYLDVSPEVWTALPGCSQRLPEATLLTRVVGVLTREAQEGLARTPRGAGDVVVTGACTVSEAFDPCFSALSCRYTYRIADAATPCDPTWRATVLWLPDVLDAEAMDASARALLGEHDFLSYCKPRGGATIARTLRALQWRRIEAGPGVGPGSGLVTLSVVTDAFCHFMVRSLMGAGLAVGRGCKSAIWSRELLDARARQSVAPVAPSHGLILGEVTHPADDKLATQVERARTTRRPSC